MSKRAVTVEHVNAGIARWKTRLRRAMTAIDKLERQKKRIEKAAAKPRVITDMREITKAPTKPEPLAVTIMREMAAPPDTKPVDDLAIPGFLQRKKLDPVAAQIKEEQAERKRLKSRGRIDKLKAKQRGDLQKMPLSGKAALDAIRNG